MSNNNTDEMVRNATTFNDWNELKHLLDEGFVPALYGKTAAERKLKKFLLTNGYQVWCGNNRRGRIV